MSDFALGEKLRCPVVALMFVSKWVSLKIGYIPNEIAI